MTTPNTLSNHYLSVMQKTTACKADFEKIVRNCQPEPDPKDNDKTKTRKKSGLLGTIKKSYKAIDEKAKSFTGYKRDKVKGSREDRPFNSNAWVEDHCAGLWVTPHSPTDKTSSDLKELMDETSEKMQDSIDNLKDELDSIWGKLDATAEIFDEMYATAIDMGISAIAEKIAKNLAIKAGVKVGVGVVGSGTLIVPFFMALWTISDIASAIKELASFMGDKGADYLNTIKDISNVDEKLSKIAKDLKEKPMKGLTNAMTYSAALNPCVSARKCLLVPYKKTTGKPTKSHAQAKHGQGCCPGQTGHHIMPDAMVKGTGCAGYDYDTAPVMCLEGTNNNEKWGSHGKAHGNLKDSMNDYRDSESNRPGGNPDEISYIDARDESVAAVRESAAMQCDKDCLNAQLDDHYKQCKKADGTSATLRPADGGGKFIEMTPKNTPKPTPNR